MIYLFPNVKIDEEREENKLLSSYNFEPIINRAHSKDSKKRCEDKPI